MACLNRKVISGKPHWYLREMARVGGKPKMVSERYLGSAADIEALLDARETATLPARTRLCAHSPRSPTQATLGRQTLACRNAPGTASE